MDGLLQDTPLTLRWLFPRLERIFPERTVSTARHGRIVRRRTYGDLARRARRLGSALESVGVAPGERVATFSHNSDDHLEQMLGVTAAGRVFHALNPRLSPAELKYIVDHAEDAAVFVDAGLLDAWRSLGPLPSVRHTIVVAPVDGETAISPDVGGDVEDYESFLARGDAGPAWPDLSETAAAALCYTSGTTGNPKGILYSHRGLVLVSLAWMLGDAMAISNRDTFLPAVPFFHAQAWALPFSALFAGSPFAIPGADVGPAALARLIQSEGVTFAIGVPTIWSNMLAAIDSGEVTAMQLAPLARIACGGSAVPRKMLEQFDALGIALTQVWGMTEMSPLGTVSRVRAEVDQAEALNYRIMQGLPQPLVDLRIVDEADNELPWNGEAAGEVQASGPWVADAYYDPSAPNGRMDADGFAVDAEGRRWLRTGDVASIDPLGYVHILDRTKDLVKSGGEWISTIWLEQIIDACDGVKASAVVSVADEKWGERPLALVERLPNRSLTVQDVLDQVRRHVPSWQVPDRVVFLDELPRTSLGKLDKRRLRQLYGTADSGQFNR